MPKRQLPGYRNQHARNSKRGAAHKWLDDNLESNRQEFFRYVQEILDCGKHSAHKWWADFKNKDEEREEMAYIDKPVKAGMYWVKFKGQVALVNVVPGKAKGFSVKHYCDTELFPSGALGTFKGAEWCGPVPEPKKFYAAEKKPIAKDRVSDKKKKAA